MNGGLCVPGADDYTCNCDGTGFSGAMCTDNVDDCPTLNDCMNNGVCVDGVNDITCDCTGTGFSGNKCQDDIDECEPTISDTFCSVTAPCTGGGVCSTDANGEGVCVYSVCLN